jgi:hypothetical protein
MIIEFDCARTGSTRDANIEKKSARRRKIIFLTFAPWLITTLTTLPSPLGERVRKRNPC